MNHDLLGFVRDKLEEREGISPVALDRLLADARHARPVWKWSLLAASVVFCACVWTLVQTTADARREDRVLNALVLLQTIDDDSIDEGESLADRLQSWQDAPCLLSLAD